MCGLYEVWEMCPQICVAYTKYGRCARKDVWLIRSMGDVPANMCSLYEVWEMCPQICVAYTKYGEVAEIWLS